MSHTASDGTGQTPPIQRYLDRTFVSLRDVAQAERAARELWIGMYPGFMHLNLMRRLMG